MPRRGCQRFRQHRLADPRYIFKQYVTFAEECHQQLIYDFVLANDDLLRFPAAAEQGPVLWRCLT